MPDLRQATEEMPDIVSPDLHWLADKEADLIQWFVYQDRTTNSIGPSKSSALRVGTENRVLLGTSGRFLCIHSV